MERALPELESVSRLARDLVRSWGFGTVVYLHGPLGVGKTTFVRAVLNELGFQGPVRSPTFNILQAFDTEPMVLHADLYRLAGVDGIGLEDYLDDHLCLIEWPERASGWLDESTVWHLRFRFEGEGRAVEVVEPDRA